jgi:hypothetical protein
MTAQIKLKHSGGNGVIIEAPASNPASDKTITLPSDEAGVFATKDSANSLQNVTGINGGQLGNRNLVINGAMQVAQRGTTDSGSATTAAYPTADRWRIFASNTDNASFNFSMPSDTPTGQGFTRSWKVDVGTAETSLDSNELFYFTQILEGQNLQQLAYGTSSAKSITLSFWVKAYQAGTYTCSIYKADQTARGVKINYTINASATWEFKTITFPGDTGGGGIDNDNGAGLFVHWVLATGSDYTSSNSMDSSWANYDATSFAHGQTVNTMSSTDNYWQITGVQLEVGSVATDFEHKSYGQELALCKRYCQKFDGLKIQARMNGSTNSDGYWQFPTMRATPSFSSDVSAGKSMEYGSIGRTVANVYGGGSSPESAYSRFNISGSGTSGHASYNNLSTGSYYLLEAEL